MPPPSGGSDNVDAALEASCDVLMALQSLRGEDAEVATTACVHVQRAIESVRRTIDELRMARRGAASITALGFVMPSPRSREAWRRAGGLATCKSEGCSTV
jgi:hypothetical protein